MAENFPRLLLLCFLSIRSCSFNVTTAIVKVFRSPGSRGPWSDLVLVPWSRVGWGRFPVSVIHLASKERKSNPRFFIDIWVLLIKFSRCFGFFAFRLSFLFPFYLIEVSTSQLLSSTLWYIFFVLHLIILCCKLIVVFALECLFSWLVFFIFFLICCIGLHLSNQRVSNVFVV